MSQSSTPSRLLPPSASWPRGRVSLRVSEPMNITQLCSSRGCGCARHLPSQLPLSEIYQDAINALCNQTLITSFHTLVKQVLFNHTITQSIQGPLCLYLSLTAFTLPKAGEGRKEGERGFFPAVIQQTLMSSLNQA